MMSLNSVRVTLRVGAPGGGGLPPPKGAASETTSFKKHFKKVYTMKFLTTLFDSYSNTKLTSFACLDDKQLWNIYQLCAVVVEYPITITQ